MELIGPPPQPTNYAFDCVGRAPDPVPDSSADSSVSAFHDTDGPSFRDLLDIINPLQHIPLVNTLYQHLTDDKEGAVADLVGGALWGGVLGLGAAVANLVVEDGTGKNISDHAIAFFGGDDSPTAVAADKASPQTDSASVPVATATPVDVVPLAAARTTPTVTPQAAQTVPAAPVEGPAMAGRYLVFGQPSQDTPVSLLPDAPAVASAAPNAATPLAPTAGPQTTGRFMVFGADAAPANALPAPETPSTAADKITSGSGPAPAPASTTVAAAAETPQPAAQTALLSAPPRAFPIPPRNGPATPRQTLPLPTTGPAAVPGNARTMRATLTGPLPAASTGSASAEGNDNPWFVGAFNQAMDKYQRAARLGSAPAATDTATGTAPIN